MHAVLIYQSTMRIPLLVSGPGVPRGVVVPPRAATIDVLPTVLGLLGFSADPALLGRDLRPLHGGRQRAVRSVVRREPLWPTELPLGLAARAG